MTDIFGFLTTASLIVLIVGLVKPPLFSRWIKNPTRKKVGLILGGIMFACFVGFGMTTDAQKATSTPTPQPTQEQAKSEHTSTPQSPVLSEQDQIKALVSDQLKGKNNMKRDNLKKIEVVEHTGGGWDVIVEFNSSDNLSTHLRQVGIEKQMSGIYISLYKSGKDIRTTSIAAYFPLADQYGNESDGVIYKSELDKEEASKVNWNADQSTLKLSILPKVWTTLFLHPEFRK
jgi:hypothetical protein